MGTFFSPSCAYFENILRLFRDSGVNKDDLRKYAVEIATDRNPIVSFAELLEYWKLYVARADKAEFASLKFLCENVANKGVNIEEECYARWCVEPLRFFVDGRKVRELVSSYVARNGRRVSFRVSENLEKIHICMEDGEQLLSISDMKYWKSIP